MNSKIRVLLVDDHAMVRKGLRAFLETTAQIEVVGEAPNGVQGIQRTTELKPDVVLMDLVMPQMDGIEATKQLQTLPEPPKVIILTSFIDDDKVFPALEAGAQGYLLKDVAADALILAIEAAHRGEAHLHPSITQKLMSRVRDGHNPAPTSTPTHRLEQLTQRESEVLQLIAQGCSNRTISEQLNISLKTVKTHVSNILAKLDLDDRTQAAIHAIKHSTTDQSN